MTMIIGTRGSELALAQARWASAELASHGIDNRLRIIKTKGDLVQDRFDKMEGKGFFTRELEIALSEGSIDLAVHSLKDLPTTMPEGLALAAITKRESPFDVLVSQQPFRHSENGWPGLNGLTVGTSSNRRVCCLREHFPKAGFVPIRGNVPTRLKKLARGDADVLVLARAGLNRLALDLGSFHVFEARPPLMVPAPGQGALGIQTREGEPRDLSFLNHDRSARCVNAERTILHALEGGCQLPLGVLIRPTGDERFELHLFRGDVDPGPKPDSFSLTGPTPESLVTLALKRLGR